MALTPDQHREVAEALYEAQVTCVWTDSLTHRYPDADIADAYAVGAMVTEIKLEAGRTVKGHKVGLTSKAMRSTTGATEPDYGTLFDDWFRDEGTKVSMATMNDPLVEIELVFVLKHDLGGPSVNAVDVVRATDFLMPAIEVVDSRYVSRGPMRIIDSIADAASCGFIMLGANQVNLADVDPRRIAGTLFKNGEVEESGVAAAVMGNPVNAVVWLARKLDEFGVHMEAGHTILSGSFIKAHPMAVGDTFCADYGELGQISFGVTQ